MQNNLRTLRKRAGKTQADMARDLGVAVSTVQNWESERTEMTGHSLVMVADYLGVPVDAVISTGAEQVEYCYVVLESEEDRLLSLYGSMSPGGKRRVMEYAEMVAKEHPKSDAVSETA